MNSNSNIYLTLAIIGIVILTTRLILPQKEHFGNPLNLLKKIGMGIVNFCVNFIDIMLVIADVFMGLIQLPLILLDVIMIMITWLWPTAMIRGVVTSIFVMTKILILMVFDMIAHILRMFFAKIFGLLKGGLWGIPHTPEQHHKHIEIETGWADRFGDHHHGPHDDINSKELSGGSKYLYRPLRCYQSVGSEGFINIAATIICPPLGVFMSFGIKGWLKILVCSVLSLAYYVPGLVYALLITTHLGLGRHITAKDCGGLANFGLRIAGCTRINNERDCNSAMIPGWRAKDGSEIRSCMFVRDSTNPAIGECKNIIYPHGIHTFGSTARLAGEVGNSESGHQENDNTINDSQELARDELVNTSGLADTIYDPVGIPDELNVDNSRISEPYRIPEGPWRYVG